MVSHAETNADHVNEIPLWWNIYIHDPASDGR